MARFDCIIINQSPASSTVYLAHSVRTVDIDGDRTIIGDCTLCGCDQGALRYTWNNGDPRVETLHFDPSTTKVVFL